MYVQIFVAKDPGLGPTAESLPYLGAQELITDSGLKEIATYADAVGPDKGIIVPVVGGNIRFTTDFVER